MNFSRVVVAALLLAGSAAAHADTYGMTEFQALGGGRVQDRLVLGPDGNLYGVASDIFPGHNGTIFRITPPFGFSTIASFSGTNGEQPNGLTLGIDGNFYGTTYSGGANGLGTVFRVTPGGVITTLHSFAGGFDGRNPSGVLARAANGTFYGFSVGTVFTISPSGQFTTIQNGVDPNFDPNPQLITGSDGDFYGAAARYGLNGKGVIFRMNSQGFVTILVTLGGSAGIGGWYPIGGVVEGGGYLYGCTIGEGQYGDNGHLYRLKLDGTGLANLAGSACDGPLLRTADGSLFGGSRDYGSFGSGYVFRVKPGSGEYTDIAGNYLRSWRGALTALPDGTLYGYSPSSVYRLYRVSDLVATAAFSVSPLKGKITFNPQATLKDLMSGAPVVGRKVTFSGDDVNQEPLCSGYTDGNGLAKCQATVLSHVYEIEEMRVHAVFENDQVYTGDVDDGPLICVGTVCAP